MRRSLFAGCLTVAGLSALTVAMMSDDSTAQVTRPPVRKPITGKPGTTTTPVSPAEARELEQRAKKTQEDFIKESIDLSKDLEKAGLFEDAKKVLEVVRKVNDEVPNLKEKIEDLNNSMLSTNKSTIELDVSKGWGDPIARVEKGKPFRIEATGSYKFTTQLTVNPKGFANEDPVREMAAGVRCGAVVALIVPVDAKGKPGKPLDPIEVGDSKDIRPQESGLLFINVNVPPGHKSTGKIDILLSGHIIRNGK